MFLKSIGNFRGIAIIAIVAGHVYSSGFTSNDLFSATIRNLITGGSSLFVFISGFMFHHVFYKKFNYKKFVKNKFQNIGIPYLILATVAIAYLYAFKVEYFTPLELMRDPAHMYRDGIPFSPSDSDWMTVFKYYLTGRFLIAYWYIPFGLLLFASAPLHMKFIKQNLRFQIGLVVILSAIAVIVQRPVAGTNAIHSLVYFTPVYLMGILFSIHNRVITEFLKKNFLMFLFLSVAMSFIQVYLGHVGNYGKPFFEYNGIDLQYIQMIFVICFLYGILEKYTFDIPLLTVISETSFAIYFIHPWLLMILFKIDRRTHHLQDFGAENNIFLYLFTLIVIVLVSVSLALLTKRIFKGSKKSRYLVGY